MKHRKQKSAFGPSRSHTRITGGFTAGLLSMSLMMTSIGLSQQPSPSASQEPKKSVSELPPGPGRDKLVATCSACHSPNLVLANGQSKEGWEELITKMIGMGASGSDEDFTLIVNYLAENLPPHAAAKTTTADAGSSPAQSTATASDAAGRGKATFAEKCGICHNADSSEKKVGPGLKGFYARGTYTSDGSKITDESLKKLIHDGKGIMPAFKDSLDAAKIDDLVAYLKTL